ncbi:hypothetical protein [Lacinutrix cladophorae]
MKLIDSKYVTLKHTAIKTNFGMVYCFKHFIVTEVNEAVIYDSKCSKELTELIFNHYGKNTCLHVISNRVNNYSVVPTYWFDFYKNENAKNLKSVSFVYYNALAYSNAKLEQTFIKCKTECFKDLQDAIHSFSNIIDKRTA